MHHRSYQSILPTHSKLLQQRWDETYFQEHRRRIKTAFPIVSTSAPKVRSHVMNKLKKQQRESERMEVVQRDNHALMVNMENIMTKGGYVDHQNSYNHWSLNYNKRANELQRIQTENIKMLGRIQSRESYYSVSEWLKDRTEKERLLKMISAHPTQRTHSARLSAKKRDSQALPSLSSQVNEKSSILEIEDSDTIASLERDKELALRKISKFSKTWLQEIRSLSNPPVGVKLAVEATSVIFPQNAQSRFSSPTALQDFLSFDKENIPSSLLEKLKPYIDNPELNSDRLKKVSLSIFGIMEWVRGVYQYGIITHKLKQLGVYPKQEPPQQKQFKDIQSSPPLLPPTKEKGGKFKIEVSDSDTIDSLEREKEIEWEIAVRSMSKVSKSSLKEMKSYSKPPAGIILVLEATYILFTHNVKPFPFLKEVQDFFSFDKENIPSSVLEKLKPYIDNPNLNSDHLKKLSLCSVGIMEWVRGVYQYGIITHKLKQLGVYPKQEPTQQEQLEDIQSSPPLLPPTKEKGGKFKIEVSDSDTIDSLEREKEISVRKMSKITNASISEIKSFSNPPPGVVLVVEATSILFTHNVQPFPFIMELHKFFSFDKENIPSSVLEKLKLYIDNPYLNSDKLKRVSFSIVCLMEWVKGAYQYGIITHKLRQLGVYPKQESPQQEQLEDPQPLPRTNSKLNIEVTDSDTIDSLEREKEIAVRNMSKISKNSLTEIKSFSKPPAAVKLVQDSTSILFTHNVQPFPFLKELQDFFSFDKENISFSVLEKLKPYIDNPDLKSDRLSCVSLSIVGVMEWVRGVYQYGIITHKLKQLEG